MEVASFLESDKGHELRHTLLGDRDATEYSDIWLCGSNTVSSNSSTSPGTVPQEDANEDLFLLGVDPNQ